MRTLNLATNRNRVTKGDTSPRVKPMRHALLKLLEDSFPDELQKEDAARILYNDVSCWIIKRLNSLVWLLRKDGYDIETTNPRREGWGIIRLASRVRTTATDAPKRPAPRLPFLSGPGSVRLQQAGERPSAGTPAPAEMPSQSRRTGVRGAPDVQHELYDRALPRRDGGRYPLRGVRGIEDAASILAEETRHQAPDGYSFSGVNKSRKKGRKHKTPEEY